MNKPAFPLSGDYIDYEGMTLRQYYAGQALIGLLANNHEHSKTMAVSAVEYADELLRALGVEE